MFKIRFVPNIPPALGRSRRPSQQLNPASTHFFHIVIKQAQLLYRTNIDLHSQYWTICGPFTATVKTKSTGCCILFDHRALLEFVMLTWLANSALFSVVRSRSVKIFAETLHSGYKHQNHQIVSLIIIKHFLRGSTWIFAFNWNNFSQNKSMFKLSGAASDAMLLWCFYDGTKCSASLPGMYTMLLVVLQLKDIVIFRNLERSNPLWIILVKFSLKAQ